MKLIEFPREFFEPKDTLDCGQIFRYKSINDGFLVFSEDKACYVYTDGRSVKIECEDEDYFRKFFDLDRDYSLINDFANNSKFDIVKKSASLAKGVRILNQSKEETLFFFIISQNNMIPRIKSIIERTAKELGEKKLFKGEEYYSFPSAKILATCSEEFLKSLGYGYRARYMIETAQAITSKQINLESLSSLDSKSLKESLMKFKGVGGKVADCVCLFAYHRADSCPVDTWIERLYVEDFKGKLKDRKKINECLVGEFGEFSGYVQQYVFYYKRSLEVK